MLTSIIRTVVPYLVGWIVTLLATAGVEVSAEFRSDLVTFLSFLIGTLYYVVARFLEKKWPKLGFLLGVPTAPVYGTPGEPPPAVDTAVVPKEIAEHLVWDPEGHLA